MILDAVQECSGLRVLRCDRGSAVTDDPKQLADEDGWKMTTEPVGEGLCLKPAHARLEAERDAALASLENAREEWHLEADELHRAHRRARDAEAERDRYRGVAEALADQNPVEGWPFGHRVNLVSLATAALEEKPPPCVGCGNERGWFGPCPTCGADAPARSTAEEKP